MSLWAQPSLNIFWESWMSRVSYSKHGASPWPSACWKQKGVHTPHQISPWERCTPWACLQGGCWDQNAAAERTLSSEAFLSPEDCVGCTHALAMAAKVCLTWQPDLENVKARWFANGWSRVQSSNFSQKMTFWANHEFHFLTNKKKTQAQAHDAHDAHG